MAGWRNWSGSVESDPARLARPDSEEALAEAIRAAARDDLELRVVGTGHSFMPVVATGGVLVSLDDWAGVESIDVERRTAIVRAGTKLHDLGPPLHASGLAMANLGDVDVQSLGGALGTGTHGTGPGLGNLPSQLERLWLVLASGAVLECSEREDPEVFRAARVSLGSLGVISRAELLLLPAYRLHEHTTREPVDAVLDRLEREIEQHRHFEFFWYPSLDKLEVKTLDPTDATPESVAEQEHERIGWSHEILPSVREMRFNEMEYSVPRAAGPDCFRAVRERMQQRHPDVVWPVEYRTLRADDAYLSTAFERDTVTISIHQDAKLAYAPCFGDVEAIFREAGGRPHWGKIHTRTAAELAELYPAWETFQRVRRALDPDGRFLNDHLRELFEA